MNEDVNFDELDATINELDNDVVDVIEPNEDDICTNEELDNVETDDDCAAKGKGRKSGEKYTYRTAMIMLNDTMRIYISENERSMHFQRKSKNDATDNWGNDGYFCHLDALLKYVLEICMKETIYTKASRDYKELNEIYKEIRNDINSYAHMINNSIKNDTYLKELRDM